MKIHAGLFQHAKRQFKSLDGMLVNANRNDERFRRYP